VCKQAKRKHQKKKKHAPTVTMTSSEWWKSRELMGPLWSRKNRPGAIDLMDSTSRSTMASLVLCSDPEVYKGATGRSVSERCGRLFFFMRVYFYFYNCKKKKT
jgi:hypothetical protein